MAYWKQENARPLNKTHLGLTRGHLEFQRYGAWIRTKIAEDHQHWQGKTLL